jgi:hypothetical protein
MATIIKIEKCEWLITEYDLKFEHEQHKLHANYLINRIMKSLYWELQGKTVSFRAPSFTHYKVNSVFHSNSDMPSYKYTHNQLTLMQLIDIID